MCIRDRFEALVESLLREGTTSAVLMTHGGVIMTILSAYGLPRARFYDWITDNGCGYSLRITPGLWMRSMEAEVYAKVPQVQQEENDNSYTVIDVARAAADRLWGEGETPQK